nr:PREDICTED: kinesin-like protein KIF18A isoform X1 [Bemisia tabaci]XP_018897896.1 PREDICTED: kinesin-like protein KIF18A isoform X1 [Bemisia tabaci]XP_018897897.1 PREDICTED: kinesin-like protein KIF18A isoform X1 [Bemisia tabaci]
MVLGSRRDGGKVCSPRNIKRFRSATGVSAAPSTSPPTNSNVQVFIRVRPLNGREREKNDRSIIDVVDSTSLIFDPKESDVPFFYHGVKQKLRDPTKRVNKNLPLTFDRVFDQYADNNEVYEHTTKDVIKTLFEGYNCSVFSYGATGAGKTYTMLGNDENKGIMYLTMVALYAELEKLREDHDITLVVGYIEVYNEVVHDLLNPESKQLHLLERNGDVVISGMKVIEINSEDELFERLVEGNKHRTQHPTDANAESSRSHAIFQVFVKLAPKGTDQFKHFKLSMIDLAGSERASATQNVKARFNEGSNINKSLLALGNVINALADNQRHIPYRDSKLTRILKDSLGGNCKTIMIANVSPAQIAYEDTYNTLKYADRAKKIKSKLQKNIVSMNCNPLQYKKMNDDLKRELSLLKAQNQKLQSQIANERPPSSSCKCKPLAQIKEWKDKLNKVFGEKESITKEILLLESQKQILQWRIKCKHFDLERVSKLENGIESSGKGRTKLESSLAQLEGRVVGVMDAISQAETKLKTNSLAIKDLVKELKKNNLYNSLSVDIRNLELTLRNNDLEQRYAHGEKLSRLQSSRQEVWEQQLTKTSNMIMKYFLLLKGFNKVTNEMEMEYKNFWKEMKAVTWDDDDVNMEQASNNNFILRPIQLFSSDSAQSSPELPTLVVNQPPAPGPGDPVSTSSNPLRPINSSNLDGTFTMPNNLKLPSPPRSMKKKPMNNWKQRVGLASSRKTPLRDMLQPNVKYGLNKENKPLPSAKMLPPSRTPRGANFKSVTAHLPTPGKTATLSTAMKKSAQGKRRNSLNKLLPRDNMKRRSMLKTLVDANQLSAVQFSKTPARFRTK